MSWDVSIRKFAVKYTSVSEIPDNPDDAGLLPLGSRAEVHSAVSEVFQGVDWSDPEWGTFDCAFGSVEFSNDGDEPLDGLTLHVRAGPEIVPLIVALCRRQGWSAIAGGTDEMLEHSAEPELGLDEWRAYRDQVISGRKST